MTKTEPDARGHWGPYGGRFVPETLMAPLEELTAAYRAARDDREFQTEFETLLRDYSGRPTPLFRAARLTAKRRRRVHLSQTRRPLAHRLAQNQQRARTGLAGAADGQAAHHRGDGRGPARRCHRDRLRAVRPRLRRLHGRGRHAPPEARTSFACNCSARKCARLTAGSRTLKDAINEALRDWVTNVCGHLLPARQRSGAASVPVDGARFSKRHRARSARADS